MTRREWNSRQAELRRGIERKLENKYAKRASGGSGSGGGSESPTSLADAVNALVQVQLAQALGNMSQPKALGNARPMSDAGAPASPPTASEDTPLWRLKQEDRDHLIRRHGLTWYRETLQKQMRGVRIKVR